MTDMYSNKLASINAAVAALDLLSTDLDKLAPVVRMEYVSLVDDDANVIAEVTFDDDGHALVNFEIPDNDDEYLWASTDAVTH